MRLGGIGDPYENAFRILSDDFHRLAEHVKPLDGNLATHSHRMYEPLQVKLTFVCVSTMMALPSLKSTNLRHSSPGFVPVFNAI